MPLHMFIHEKRENIFILLRKGKKRILLEKYQTDKTTHEHGNCEHYFIFLVFVMVYHLSTFKNKTVLLLTCLFCQYYCTILNNLKLNCVVHGNKNITFLQKKVRVNI